MANQQSTPEYSSRSNRSPPVTRVHDGDTPARFPSHRIPPPPPPYVESVASLDALPVVVSAGMAAQRRRRVRSARAHSVARQVHPHPPVAPPQPPPSYIYSSFLASLENADGLPSVLRAGDLAQARPRRTDHHGARDHAGMGVSRPRPRPRQHTPWRPGAVDHESAVPPPSASPVPARGASSPLPAPPARRHSETSMSSIQEETFFHVRRPDDAQWGRN